jgi:hypothetical protein
MKKMARKTPKKIRKAAAKTVKHASKSAKVR